LSWENWTLPNLLADRPDKWQLSLMAMFVDDPIGYAVASRRNEHTVHLHHLIVSRDWRNKQVGQLLLDRLIGKVQKMQVPTVTLKVHQKNSRAIAFYQRNKFSTVKPENDLLWMTVALDHS
jgi:ribosomal protein S18 acetylase RimI-like enzyme